MLNQNIHQNLRRNKNGIPLDSVRMLSPNYVRPPGFALVPSLLKSTPNPSSEQQKLNPAGSSYYQYVKEEAQRCVLIKSFFLLFKQFKRRLRYLLAYIFVYRSQHALLKQLILLCELYYLIHFVRHTQIRP